MAKILSFRQGQVKQAAKLAKVNDIFTMGAYAGLRSDDLLEIIEDIDNNIESVLQWGIGDNDDD